MSGLAMPKPDAGDAGAPRRDRRRHARSSCRARAWSIPVNEMRAFESDGLTAYRQLPLVVVLPETDGAGLAHPEILQRAQHPRRAARLRHLAVGRRAAAGGRRAAGHEPLQPHPRHRFPEPRGGRAAGRHQSRHHPGGRGATASTMPPIPPRRSPARSAATSRRIPAACIA